MDVKGKTAAETGGGRYLFLFNTESRRYVFIGALSEEDSEDWFLDDNHPVQAVPADGRYLLFLSRNDLTADAAGSGRQVYRLDAQAAEEGRPGSLLRVSVADGGINQDGNSGLSSRLHVPTYVSVVEAASQGGAISEDGSRVFFLSQAGLVPGAFEWCVRL